MPPGVDSLVYTRSLVMCEINFTKLSCSADKNLSETVPRSG